MTKHLFLLLLWGDGKFPLGISRQPFAFFLKTVPPPENSILGQIESNNPFLTFISIIVRIATFLSSFLSCLSSFGVACLHRAFKIL